MDMLSKNENGKIIYENEKIYDILYSTNGTQSGLYVYY